MTVGDDLAGGRGAQALGALLEEWRASRAPLVAELIAALGRKLSTCSAPSAAPGLAGMKALIERVRGASDEELSGVLGKVDRFVRDNRSRFTGPVLDVLADREPDPRVAELLVGLIKAGRAVEDAGPRTWEAVLGGFRSHADPRFYEELRRIERSGQLRAWRQTGAQLKSLVDQLARKRTALAPGLSAVELERVGALLSGPVKKGRRGPQAEAALLAAIYAHPEDDGPRLIYADWLLERGDPRGELISLQLGAADRSTTERQLALIAQHQNRWLPAIWDALEWRSIVFRRGFLAECSVSVAGGHQEALVFGEPEWATVERVRFSGPHALGSFKALQQASGVSIKALVEWGAARQRSGVRELQIEVLAAGQRKVRQALGGEPPLRLSALSLRWQAGREKLELAPFLEWLWKQPIGGRLERLGTEADQLEAAAGLGGALTRAPAMLRSFSFQGATGDRLALQRRGASWAAALSGSQRMTTLGVKLLEPVLASFVREPLVSLQIGFEAWEPGTQRLLLERARRAAKTVQFVSG